MDLDKLSGRARLMRQGARTAGEQYRHTAVASK